MDNNLKPGDYILNRLNNKGSNEEALIKAFIRTGVPMMLIHRSTGSVMDVNQSTLDFYGYTYEEIIKKRSFDFDVKSRIEIKDIYRRLLDGEENFELYHKKADGTLSIIYSKLTLFKLDDIDYILVFFDDITKAKNNDNQQKYELNKYRQLFNNTRNGIVFMDPYDHIIEMNERFMEIFKVGKEVYGKSINDIVTDDTTRKEADELSIIGFSGNKYDINTIRVRNDGTHFNVNVQVIPVYFQNRLMGVYGIYSELNELTPSISNNNIIIHDIPDIEQKLQLHSRLSTLNDLANKISHEINTPLGISITGSSYMNRIIADVIKTVNENLVSKKYIRDNLIDLQDSMNLITKNLGYIKNTIDLIKDISYELIYDFDEIDLESEIDNILLSMKEITKNLKIPIEINCSEHLLKRTSKTLLKNIIYNLIENAIYHAVDNWETFKISITIETTNDKIRLIIEDNGKGMDPVTTKKIFDPFYSGSKLGDHYLGLGLSIVYNIVTFFLDGTIQVESNLEKGTKFIITI